jgi:hypothetical protein
MPVKKTVDVVEEAHYTVEVEVDENLDNEAVEALALEQFLQRGDPNAGFVAVLDRHLSVRK